MGLAMDKEVRTQCFLNDSDINKDYLRDKLWSMINCDGKVDEVERAYYDLVQQKLKSINRTD